MAGELHAHSADDRRVGSDVWVSVRLRPSGLVEHRLSVCSRCSRAFGRDDDYFCSRCGGARHSCLRASDVVKEKKILLPSGRVGDRVLLYRLFLAAVEASRL